jgi:hypothetical protein
MLNQMIDNMEIVIIHDIPKIQQQSLKCRGNKKSSCPPKYRKTEAEGGRRTRRELQQYIESRGEEKGGQWKLLFRSVQE